MSRIRDALERWREAERALAASEPGSPEERRARSLRDHAKATYQRLMDDDVEGHQMAPPRDPEGGDGPDAA